ncbi:MAG TPA: DsbA family oxidoreductase [Sphingobacteriaceae bacterium]
MKVEIWSDIMCPFCYIGKRRFETALAELGLTDRVDLVWKSFQLDPDLEPVPGQSIHQYLAIRKGVSEDEGRRMNEYMTGMAAETGLEYQMDRIIVNNTLDAHRLLHLAAESGLQSGVKERLFKAYYTEGRDIGNPEVLREIGRSAGIDEKSIADLLATDRFRKEVRADQLEAQQLGAGGVPFFVLNRKYGISGAQSAETFSEVLRKVLEEEKPGVIAGDGPSCDTDGNC